MLKKVDKINKVIYNNGSLLSAAQINSVYGVEVSLKEHKGKKVIIPEKAV